MAKTITVIKVGLLFSEHIDTVAYAPSRTDAIKWLRENGWRKGKKEEYGGEEAWEKEGKYGSWLYAQVVSLPPLEGVDSDGYLKHDS